MRIEKLRRCFLNSQFSILSSVVALAAVLSAALMLAPAHAASDVIHYKYWARLVTVEGIARAYSGTYPETAAIYPPLTMYGYRLAGLVYQAAVEPSFDLDRALGSRALSLLVKLVAVIPHLVTIGAIFWLLRVRNRTASGSAGPRIAVAAAAAYGLNPASLFDLAYWGQPDSVHALFLLLAIWCLEEGRSLWGWGFAGLAATAKPQVWALLPFVAYVSVRRFGFAKSTLGVAVAVLVGLGVCLPFLLAGTFGDLLSLPGLITSTMPVVSANAHNLWWLATEARPEFVFDAEPLLGPFTYRQLAAALTVAVYGYGLWKTDPRGRDGALLAMAACGVRLRAVEDRSPRTGRRPSRDGGVRGVRLVRGDHSGPREPRVHGLAPARRGRSTILLPDGRVRDYLGNAVPEHGFARLLARAAPRVPARRRGLGPPAVAQRRPERGAVRRVERVGVAAGSAPSRSRNRLPPRLTYSPVLERRPWARASVMLVRKKRQPRARATTPPTRPMSSSDGFGAPAAAARAASKT